MNRIFTSHTMPHLPEFISTSGNAYDVLIIIISKILSNEKRPVGIFPQAFEVSILLADEHTILIAEVATIKTFQQV